MTITRPALLFLALTWITPRLHADDGVLLKLTPQPNRMVELTMTSATEFEFDANGDEKFLEQSRRRGLQFPLKTTQFKSRKILTVTGPIRGDGSFRLERKVEESSSYVEDAEGRQLLKPSPLDQAGVTLTGSVDKNGVISIEDLTGVDIGEQQRKFVDSVLKSISTALNGARKGPTQPLRIGDSYTMQVPMNLPIPGQGPMLLNSRETYKLSRISGDLAYFDLNVTVDLSGASLHMEASGTGKGEMAYNFKTQLEVRSGNDLDLSIRIGLGELVFSGKVHSRDSMEQSIVSPGRPGPEEVPNKPKSVPDPDVVGAVFLISTPIWA